MPLLKLFNKKGFRNYLINNPGALNMDFLPDEVIAQVLFYIHPIYSDLLKLRQVCWKWKIIIETTCSLWKHIHLDDDRDCITERDYEYTAVLRFCLKTYGHFIHCLRGEDQPYLNSPETRKIIPKLGNLHKLDVPWLVWTKDFAENFESKRSLKHVTIDDCMIQDVLNASCLVNRKAIIGGLKGCDLYFIHSWFPNLEVLGLHTSINKIRRGSMVSILDAMVKLKELYLELTPYAPKPRDDEPNNASGAEPVREIMNSRHCSTLTRLELRYLAISSKDLMDFTRGLKGLRHLVVGSVATMNYETFTTTLILESSTLQVLFLSSLPSSWTKTIKITMSNLEVLVISQCIELTSLELQANNLLTLILRDNISLNNISANCESITDFELLECQEFDQKKFQNFMKECPSIMRVELSVEWESIELNRQDSPELRKLIIRGVNLLLSRVEIDCPTLEVFKCFGCYAPKKNLRPVEYKGCQFEIICDDLSNCSIRDVFHTKGVRLRCQSVDTLDISGRSLALSYVDIDIVTIKRINVISVHKLNMKSVSICCPSVGDIIMSDCCLLHNDLHSCKMKIKCNDLEALRVIKCDRIKRFALKVPRVGQLSLDSCSRLFNLKIAHGSKVGLIRVVNCPLLKHPT